MTIGKSEIVIHKQVHIKYKCLNTNIFYNLSISTRMGFVGFQKKLKRHRMNGAFLF